MNGGEEVPDFQLYGLLTVVYASRGITSPGNFEEGFASIGFDGKMGGDPHSHDE